MKDVLNFASTMPGAPSVMMDLMPMKQMSSVVNLATLIMVRIILYYEKQFQKVSLCVLMHLTRSEQQGYVQKNMADDCSISGTEHKPLGPVSFEAWKLISVIPVFRKSSSYYNYIVSMFLSRTASHWKARLPSLSRSKRQGSRFLPYLLRKSSTIVSTSERTENVARLRLSGPLSCSYL